MSTAASAEAAREALSNQIRDDWLLHVPSKDRKTCNENAEVLHHLERISRDEGHALVVLVGGQRRKDPDSGISRQGETGYRGMHDLPIG